MRESKRSCGALLRVPGTALVIVVLAGIPFSCQLPAGGEEAAAPEVEVSEAPDPLVGEMGTAGAETPEAASPEPETSSVGEKEPVKASGGPGGGAQAIKPAVDRGSRFLADHQNPDGGYGPYGMIVSGASDVGITAFCLYALARNPRGYSAADGPFISRAVKFLLDRQQVDGSFHDPKDPSLRNYKTSVGVLALDALDPVNYSGAIRKARDFVKTQQANAAQGYHPDEHVNFGGQGYGSSLRTDLSNAQFAAESLYRSGLSASDEYWAHLVVFVSRCQNSETVDPLLQELRIGTTGDGGFRYSPMDSRGPVETLDDGTRLFSSYGSMSYAGLKTLLYARVARDDPRVQQAFGWISRNFTVEVNPGMATDANPDAGQHGLYYYYHTMAKALSVYGEPIIRDAKGAEHDWALELSAHLIKLQSEDGHWVNTSDRWYENLPSLDTAYAIVTLCECQEFIESRAEGE